MQNAKAWTPHKRGLVIIQVDFLVREQGVAVWLYDKYRSLGGWVLLA